MNYHNIVNQQYSDIKYKVKKEQKLNSLQKKSKDDSSNVELNVLPCL